MRSFRIGIRRFCAVLIGAVFFVAGLLKVMDPFGSNLVMESYLRFFHLEFLMGISSAIATVTALFETFLGTVLLAGLWRKITAVITFCTLGFFTIITAILLIFNPEMSCGCFGQALELTHLQSFVKNVILSALACAAFIPLSDGVTPRIPKYFAFGLVVLCVAGFALYSAHHLPLQDFGDYSAGVELEDRNLSFRDQFGEYSDSLILEGKVLMVSVYNPEALTENEWADVTISIDKALSNNVLPLLLVSCFDGVPVELSEFMYFADGKTLMTLNRSNGGSAYVEDGLIVQKWTRDGMPDYDKFADIVADDPYDVMLEGVTHRRVTFQGGLLAALALLLLV